MLAHEQSTLSCLFHSSPSINLPIYLCLTPVPYELPQGDDHNRSLHLFLYLHSLGACSNPFILLSHSLTHCSTPSPLSLEVILIHPLHGPYSYILSYSSHFLLVFMYVAIPLNSLKLSFHSLTFTWLTKCVMYISVTFTNYSLYSTGTFQLIHFSCMGPWPVYFIPCPSHTCICDFWWIFSLHSSFFNLPAYHHFSFVICPQTQLLLSHTQLFLSCHLSCFQTCTE